MKVLITGFGPFRGFDTNPSQLVVEQFKIDSNIELRTAIIDVNRAYVENEYPKILEDFQPDFILNIGLNAKAGGLELETFAINSLKGDQKFQNIDEGLAYQTKVDTKALSDHLCELNIPSARSDYAGSYYCNFIFYLSLKWCKKNGGDAIFLHMPLTQNLASQIRLEKNILYPSLPEETITEGIRVIIDYCMKLREQV